jgi:hypothetical protein
MIAKTFKTLTMIAILSVASVILFAASGGKGKKGAKTNVSISVKQSTQSFSLRSGYKFKGGKLLQFDNTKKQYISLNSYITVKQGNNTVNVASKHLLNKAPILSGSSRTSYQVSFLKLKFD